ncbi:insulinase family protein [Shewanella sp. 1CM18E]|uniref:M16 family metallopeptidase n=1 Tax=Shewanella sp. 1CM18E TaxID=2929169 RepID=UPI0020BED39E|nr:pitrilysin family protein [Shewanella sp. 1CM18E]MCK8044382.1 insulinase family protein [Shewanella sp. 1CM18E]
MRSIVSKITKPRLYICTAVFKTLAVLSTISVLAFPVSAQDRLAPQSCDLSALAQPLYDAEQQIQYRLLDNGLQVRTLALENTQAVSIASQFDVGSRNEVKGQTGYAHLFEHMLFKGSQHAPGDSYTQTISALSGQFNASTFFDFTNYYLTIPSQALELSLWLEADRFRYPMLTQATVSNQQGAVLEEMATTIDNQPYVRKAMEFLLSQVSGTPYGHAVIGSVEDVKAATPESLNAFHQRYYRPDSMQLSLVGDIPQQTQTWIDSQFGDWQAPDNKRTQLDDLVVTPKPVHGEIVDERGPWPAVLLAWHTAGSGSADAPGLALIEAYLFQNKSSLLQATSLNDPEQLLSYSIPLTMTHHGVTNLVLVPRARTSLDTLTENAEALINRVASEPLAEPDLCQLKQIWLNNALKRLDSPSLLSRYLSASQTRDKLQPLTGPWERINAVSSTDIQAITQKYFVANTVRLDLLPPWYIRATKSILEFLPKGMSDSLEESVM